MDSQIFCLQNSRYEWSRMYQNFLLRVRVAFADGSNTGDPAFSARKLRFMPSNQSNEVEMSAQATALKHEDKLKDVLVDWAPADYFTRLLF